MVSDLPTYLLPRPVDVFHCLTDNARWQWHNQVLVTTIEILGGFALAAVLGIVMGVLVAWSKFTSKMILPFLVFFNSLPKIALVKSLIFQGKQLVNGVSVFSISEGRGLWIGPELAAHSFFPPEKTSANKSTCLPTVVRFAHPNTSHTIPHFANIQTVKPNTY